MKLTHYQTQDLTEVLEIGGDLLLLPSLGGEFYEEVRSRRAQTVRTGESVARAALVDIFPLSEKYRAYRRVHGQEPDWVNAPETPVRVRIRLRLDYAQMEENPLAIGNAFKHTGLSYMVREGGLCSALSSFFGIYRLSGIKQLGFLQAPWFTDSLQDHSIGNHNRWIHSLDVMTIATVIGHNLDLEEKEMNTLRTMAFTHDALTPAGGDSVKLVDLDAFDEDRHYPELLKRDGWEELRAHFHIDEWLLVRGILNEGLLGQVLDIADKLAYTARDLFACMHHLEYGREHMDQYTLDELFRLLTLDPNVCSLWDSIECRGQQMVFMDPARLIAFLKVRALMFRELYYHPNARFGEYLVSRVLVKALYLKGVLTRNQLVNMRDYELSVILDQEYMGRHTTSVSIVEEAARAGPQRKTFSTKEEALRFLAKLRADGNPFSILEDTVRTIKTGGHFLVMTNGGPQPLSVAYPDRVREIEEMVRPFSAVHVYYLEREPGISRVHLAELQDMCRSLEF